MVWVWFSLFKKPTKSWEDIINLHTFEYIYFWNLPILAKLSVLGNPPTIFNVFLLLVCYTNTQSNHWGRRRDNGPLISEPIKFININDYLLSLMLIRYVEQYIGVQEREILYSWGAREILSEIFAETRQTWKRCLKREAGRLYKRRIEGCYCLHFKCEKVKFFFGGGADLDIGSGAIKENLPFHKIIVLRGHFFSYLSLYIW